MTKLLYSILVFIWTLSFDHRFFQCWENGLARTPPMGWMSWLKFACNVDCINYPNECINEQLYKDMIDRLVEDGYSQLGYNTVNIDDCWMEMERDPNTSRLVANKTLFPSGIRSLADYAHAKGIQLGIYEDVGTKTCGGYPGTRDQDGFDYTYIDARTFSEWRVDSLKLDGCYAEIETYNRTYPEYSKALSKQKHKIVYACSWLAYLNSFTDHEYRQIKEYCNYWRNYDDIMDSWRSVSSIIDFYRKNNQKFEQFHGPGGWFDPDMLIIGNDGLSYEQSKTQMAFWCIWSAPLLMSNDLRTIKPEFKEILMNKHLIAIDQDPLGKMGIVLEQFSSKWQQVWTKKLSPERNGENSFAILYYNNDTIGVPAIMSHKLNELIPELKSQLKYDVHDLFNDNRRIATLNIHQKLTLRVPISGSVRLVKLMPRLY